MAYDQSDRFDEEEWRVDGRIGQFIGDTMTTVVEHPIVQGLSLGIAVTVATLWLATAYWVLADMRRRHADPTLGYLAAGGVVVASPLFFPLALGIYLILRPSETLGESRQQRLAELAVELEEEVARCPECSLLAEEDWLACPACRTRLGHRCVECGRTMSLDWIVCAWCATDVPDAGAIAQTDLPGPRLVPVGPGRETWLPEPAERAEPAEPGATPVPVLAAAEQAAERDDEPGAPAPVFDGGRAEPHPEHVAAIATGSVGGPVGTFLGRRFAINRHR